MKAESNRNFSIHPRNWPGGDHVKSNTCGKPSVEKLLRALEGLERHSEAHPKDSAALLRIGNLKRRIQKSM